MGGSKPFGFVETAVVPKTERSKEHHRFDQERLTGRLTVRLRVLTPIHIFSGAYEMDGDGQLFKKFAHHNDHPAIPGSSLKGMVRSIAEGASCSCTRGCGNSRESCRDEGKLCITCRVFGFVTGSKRFKGRVQFEKLNLVGDVNEWMEILDIPALHSPKKTPSLKVRKFYYHSTRLEVGKNFPGPKGPHQVARIGSVFEGYIHFSNLSREELALLAFALGLDRSFHPKLGYAKSAYLGSVEIELVHAESLLGRYGIRHRELPDVTALAAEWEKFPSAYAKGIEGLRRVLSWKEPKGPAWKQGLVHNKPIRNY